MPYVDTLKKRRRTAEELAASIGTSYFGVKHIPVNSVGFRGKSALINIDLVSPIYNLDHATRSERTITVEDLQAALATAILGGIFPVVECPVAVLEEVPTQTKKLDIKELATTQINQPKV